MKKLIIGIFIIVLSFSVVGCALQSNDNIEENEETVFEFALPEWVKWGMMEGEVRQCLNDNVHEYGDLIYCLFTKEYKESDVNEYYGFSEDNALVYVSYCFNHSGIGNDDKNKYHEIFTDFVSEMTAIYGEPISDDEQWTNTRYKSDEYMLYKAIEDGDYVRKVKWATDGYFCSVELNKRVNISYAVDENNV